MTNFSALTDEREYIATVLPRLTVEEKVLLLAGKDLWRTNAIPRLGVSEIKTSDGPVGVRGGLWTDGVPAAFLPSGVSLAATWDRGIIEEVCGVLVDEARSKEVNVLLGPTVCIPRTPLGGRNFEAFSEDPFLTGKLAATYIKSLQDAGIGACIKHFAANDQETRRFVIDEIIPERALREIHLQPFQIAIRDSKPWTIMTAYNKINGIHCSAHEELLQKILREEWGFDGLVMSDWFGTNTVVPSVIHGVLQLLHRTGKYKYPDWKESREKAVDLPTHRGILRKAAAEGIVLLKNDEKILPLDLSRHKKIAFIGPNAGVSIASGGGSSSLLAHYSTNPKDCFSEAVKSDGSIQVSHAPGLISHRYIPLVDPSVMTNPKTKEPGFAMEWWRNMQHEGNVIHTENRPSSHLICYDGLPPSLTTGERYSYRATTILTPKTSGLHTFSLSTCGPGKLILNGEVLIDIDRHANSPKSSLFMSYGSPEERVEKNLEAGNAYELIFQAVSREPQQQTFTYHGDMLREEIMDGGRVGFLEEVSADLFTEAIQLARASDLVIMVVGRNNEWETETSDIISMELPLETNNLIAEVLEVNKNTVVVNQTGGPVSMPWIQNASTVVQAWYQGQEQGRALTDVLLGKNNPCGKLPITFPVRLEDNPSYYNHPGGNDCVHYGEGIFLGYRHYDKVLSQPLFPFGHGLSYTSFTYSNLRISIDSLASLESMITVSVDIKNIGTVAGKEIVQFYVSQMSKPGLIRPVRELKGFEKVHVNPGQTVTATAVLDKIAVSYWDDGPHSWRADADATFAVEAASSSRDVKCSATFRTGSGFLWAN
ncbi:hypothetical protein IFR05_015923 [Cadophora sp. M221]|nr:hypothetical protein IFR05_015923 [Cadophora sp. M221]